MTLRRITSGAPWEARVGYCRAVVAGGHIHVSGTVAVEADGTPHAPGNPYAQTVRALEIILRAMAEAGAEARHVVRTRVFVTDITRWEEVGRAHREVLGDHPPAMTMVEVSALMDPAFLVEVEVDAFLPE
jgi:enamine deaminase RidA (YjgF/YER057c/UK114 family)